jgi:hypothetical protein
MKGLELRGGAQPVTNDEVLVALYASGGSPLEALLRLFAHHTQAAEGAFRRAHVVVGAHVFPVAEDVPSLLALLFDRVRRLWDECRSPVDDVHVAAFAVTGLLCVHPFANANGRVALDMARLLLMQRFGIAAVPFVLPRDAQKRVDAVFVSPVARCDGLSVQAFLDQRAALGRVIASASLESLKVQEASHRIASLLVQWWTKPETRKVP